MNIFSSKSAAFLCFLALILGVSCKKQIVNEYEMNPIYTANEQGYKGNIKTDLQLITIMYADVFGTSLSNAELKSLNQAYTSFGDKDIVIDRITQYFLTNQNAQLPSDSYMRLNLDQFLRDAYNRLYVRQPTEAELYYLKKVINNNSSLTARDVYYAMLTSQEYKYY